MLNGDKATYTSKGCALSENGDQYYCVITDANGKTVTSNKATLTVTAAATELKITSQPQGITVEWGDGHGPFNPVFSVAVSGGKAPYKYEWHLVDVLGGDHLCSEIPYIVADSDTLTFENFNVTAAIEAKAFYCVITDSAGKTVTSNNAYVTVSATQIYFSKQPANRSVMSGSETTFSVIVRGGTGFYGYRWYKLCDGETEALSNDGDYEGANRDTLTVKSADIWDDGAQFYCVVKDYGTEQQITSAKGSLTVY